MNEVRKVYYAHVMSIYNTPQETRDLLLIRSMGLDYLNPNSPEIQEACNKEKLVPGGDCMTIFHRLIDMCDILAFRSLPDGSISAGVANEIDYATLKGIPIVELPTFFNRRKLTPDETRAYLALVGER